MQIYTCFRKMQDRLHRERYAFLFNSSSAVIDYCFSWKNSYLVCNFCIFQCWPTCRVYYSVWIIRLHENNEKQKKKKKWKQVGGQRKSMLDRNKQAKTTTNKQEKKNCIYILWSLKNSTWTLYIFAEGSNYYYKINTDFTMCNTSERMPNHTQI